jgi:hypothetical protein
MLDCWQKERADRPKFVAILRTLDKLMEFPELLVEIAKPRYVSQVAEDGFEVDFALVRGRTTTNTCFL